MPDPAPPFDDSELPRLTTAGGVADAARRIYGSELTTSGVLHVTAVWWRDEGPLVTLRTGQGSPRCHHDALALGLARARADAVITTGEILRRESGLRLTPPGSGELSTAVTAWRREVRGKPTTPILWVMTRSGDVDLDHPVFRHGGRSVVYTGRDSAWALESRAPDAGVELVTASEPSIHDGIQRLRREFGAATIVVEAGPSVSRRLYEPPDDESAGVPIHTGVDELLLTVLHRADLETRFRGPRFLPRSDIEARLGPPRSSVRITAGPDVWELARYVRSA